MSAPSNPRIAASSGTSASTTCSIGGATAEELETHREAFGQGDQPPELGVHARHARSRSIRRRTPSTPSTCDKLGWHIDALRSVRRRSEPRASRRRTSSTSRSSNTPTRLPTKDSETFDRLVEEYLASAEMAPADPVRAGRLVRQHRDAAAVVRGLSAAAVHAWPSSRQKLGVDSAANIKNGVAKRAGMTVSGVSRNNRVVERHPSRYGFYWKSFDFKSNRGHENVFGGPDQLSRERRRDDLHAAQRPQGYYVSDSKGHRLEFGPDRDRGRQVRGGQDVRNGLSCIRCHDAGMKGFSDNGAARPAEPAGRRGVRQAQGACDLYPEQKEMDALVKKDGTRFTDAMTELLGERRRTEPLIPVTRRLPRQPADARRRPPANWASRDRPTCQAVFRAPAFAASRPVAPHDRRRRPPRRLGGIHSTRPSAASASARRSSRCDGTTPPRLPGGEPARSRWS